jgi:hypothetical protein
MLRIKNTRITMTADEYLASLLLKYQVNVACAQAAGQSIYPVLERWGNQYLLSAEFSGSLAKGTAVSLGTDADIFLSVSSTAPGTLAEIYNTLFTAVTEAGYSPRKQNVSIGVTANGYSIDLVPGRRQSQGGADHSLYKNKTQSWTQTNVTKHISYVKGSGRTDEIRVIKVWRQLHKLEFPSFFLEMAAIDALAHARRGELAANVRKVLEHLRDRIQSARYVDPSNTNNIISDDCTAQEKRSIAMKARSSLGEANWGGIVW